MKGFSNLANIGQKLLWHGKLWPQVFLPYTNLLHLGTRFKKWPVPNIIFINFEISHNETSFGFNDIHSHGKTVFCSIQYKNGWLAASDLFDMFIDSQLTAIIHSIITYYEYRCLKNVIMVTSSSKFYGKIWVGFCLNTGKRFFLEVSFQSQQKEHRFF